MPSAGKPDRSPVSQVKRGRIFYGWWVVILLAFGGGFGGATIWHTFTTFFNPLIKEFGWSYTAISLAASLRGAELGLADIFIGFVIDRLGARRIIFTGTVLIGIGYIMLSRVSSLPMFYFCYILIFVGGSGLSNVIFFTVITRWFHRRMGLALGITAAGYGLGGLAVPGVVRLLDAVGFRMTFFIFGISAMVVGAFISYFVRGRPEDIGLGPDGLPPEPVPERASKKDVPAGNFTLRQAIRTRTFWIVMYLGGAMTFSTSTISTHVMPYLENIGYPRYTASIVAMMVPIMSMVGRIGFGGLSDRVKFRLILVLTIIGEATAVLLFRYASLSFLLVPFVMLFGACTGGVTVLRPVILKSYFGSAYIGSLIGFCMGLANFAVIIGPVMAGRIFDSMGSYSLAWLIVATVLSLGLPLVLLMKRPQAAPVAAAGAV